ncbi:unnamed protein product [Euphydryas editha]|uniref:Uncharacterized protein n=1 Tax=Euphydryas editha TaxID=104508 RepID=A0AAU9VE36_EUPED|nr:unnamed protein product [Euphydryas editha]
MRREIGGREVEWMSSTLRSPHPACHVNLEFKCLVDQEQLMANNGHDFNIIRDGSKIESKVSAALSLWSGAAETKTLKLVLKRPSLSKRPIARSTRWNSWRYAGRRQLGQISWDLLRLLVGTADVAESKGPPSPGRRGMGLSAWCFAPEQTCKFVLDQSQGLRTGGERAYRPSGQAALKSKRSFDYDSFPVSFIKRSIRMQI